MAEPNDPRYLDGSLWGLHNTGQDGGTAGADIDAPGGWAVTTDASTVVVGIVDTGIRLTHEDLVANLWVNPLETADGTDTDGNGFIDDIHGINAIQLSGDPDDDQGHGTHVAGTVGAVGDNGVGVVGVAWNVQLMGLKFLAASGGGAVSDAILCIDYGVENGAHILNNSWGGSYFSQALLDAIEASRDAGVIFVAAAGNSATNNDVEPVYPAALPVENIVTVASTTRTDTMSGFSCFGQGTVDLGAPGQDILSTGHENDSHYRTLSGTSMASPHVAGALALLRAEFPGDTWDQLIHRMHRGTDVISSLGDGVVGNGGRLNLANALTTSVNRPPNDDFADGRVVHGDRAVLRVNLRSATAEPGEPLIAGETNPNTLWYRFTPAASGTTSVTALAGESLWNPMNDQTTHITYDVIPAVFGVFTGDSVNDLTEIVSGAESLSFTATAGVTYHIAVAGEDGAEGLVMLDITGAPANSTLDNAITLSLNSPRSGTNMNALSEPGEPDHAGQPAAASVWYKWTANMTGRLAFTTRGSNFDTVAAVYTGPATEPTFATLVPVGANDNAVGSSQTFSRVEFQAIAGTTYYFAVDGKNGATGNIAVTLAIPPANDSFENAAVLSGTDVTRGVTTAFGSREAGEPVHWPNSGAGETVWYTWTAPEHGRTSLDLSGSFFRGIIAVYTGNAVNNLNLVARDGAGNRFAQLTFEAIQGTTYRIAVDAWDFSLMNAPLRLQMVPIPANDNFADAGELLGIRATATGSIVGATREPGETGRDGPSVWHKWTAPATGEYGVYGERLNKDEDRWIIVLNVFTGTAVDDLTHIREDQMNGIGRDAFLRFQATAGTTYSFQVTGLTAAGITGGVGPYRLDLRPIAEHAPENNTFANAVELDGSPVFNYRTQNYGASAEPGEPDHSGYEPDRTLWWKFAVPPGQAGEYVVATTLSEGSVGTTVYRADNPANPSVDALTEVGSNVEFANQNFPSVTWDAEEGEVYYIVSDRYSGARGRVVFNFQKVPDNITFANAAVIPAEGLEEVVYNYGAVRESGEPTGGFTPATAGHRSLWWTWTAPASGRYQVDTIGSRLAVYEDAPISEQFGNPTILGLDTVLGVYTGSAVNALNTVATNSRVANYAGSNWSFQRNSRLEFNAVEGTTYHIMVNGNAFGQDADQREQNTHQGEIFFRFKPVVPPANNAFANATEITGTEYSTLVTNLGAGKESGEPDHGGINGGRSLWWKWTAPESGPFIVSTAGNLFDDYNARRTGIGVYTGSAVNALSTLGSNQNAAGLNTGEYTWSAVQFNAVAGTTYHFGVDAVHAGNLSFMLTRPAPNDNFANATVMQGSRWVTTGHNLLTGVEPGEEKIESFFNPPTPTNANVRSVWWRWTAPVSGSITIDTLGSQVYNVMGVYTGSAPGALTPIAITTNSGSSVVNGEGPNRQRGSNKHVTFDAVAGTTYHITVQGAGFTVASSGPIALALEGPPAVPFAPENFAAVRTGPSLIELTWDDIAVDEEYYEIQRSNDGVSWGLLHETNPDVEAYNDFDTGTEDDYYYRIRAVNSVGQSAWVSASVTVPQPPAAPGNLIVTALSASDLHLTWDAPATAESQWLERSDSGPSGPWTVLDGVLPGSASGYTDTGLAPETTYHYRLRATNPLGHSDWAAASGATPAVESYSIDMPAEIDETAGSFQAAVHRTGSSGSQVMFLSASDARLSVPQTVTIPDGQSSADFTVTVIDDGVVNPSDIGTITAFAPAALIGESFTGPVDTELAGQITGWGWGGNWIGVNASPVLVEPALSYTQNGSIGTPGTRAARLTNVGSGGQAYRAFSQKYTTGSVWVSSLLYRDSTNWGTQMILRDNPGSGAWGRVIYQNSTNHWVLEASGATAPTPNENPVQQLLASNPYPTTFFVVMEFDYTNRKIRAWMNPDVSGGSPANALALGEVDMQSTMTGINRLDILGHSNLDQFDEIRVATSFADLYGGVTTTRAIRIVDDEAPSPPGPIALWRLEHFYTLDPDGDAAPDADPDGDGIPNILEYALGGDPNVPDSAPRAELGFMDVDNETYVTFRIDRNPNASDIDYSVQTTNDLLAEWLDGEDHVFILEDSPGLLRIRLTTPLSADTIRFLRLAVQPKP
ncbi:MAG: S8 family serine peptidase [Verrucomicrobia bacterium]|nr:S8 family serine peptidase [Verrucomicrobiota bacterium]